ncbi:LysR family transcriptional regulator [Mycolicibacterium goodii]|uniref:LysR family transcriptional regulator n=1 Tax=Mycolicibacterium goodii TaxID=134601 RepID=UPI000C269A5E|nr:LysR family transcriptional regulator [Mycolicibacterium goodii]PJK20760.1 LysR family transcriptional regulator [Mycolicibacterium goodii]
MPGRHAGEAIHVLIVVELRELRAFVAVVEEGGISAAARRLHVSQSALSQTVNSMERELGVALLVRNSAGVRPTDAGRALLTEARAVLTRYTQAIRTIANTAAERDRVIRLGIPLELPSEVLPLTLARFADTCSEVRVVPKYLSTTAQLAALRSDQLDVGLVRELPSGAEFDSMLVVREKLGVLVTADLAEKLGGPGGVPLEALAGLDWVGFPRAGSPAWHDELTAIFRAHGVDVGHSTDAHNDLIATVKLAAVSTGQAFALAPSHWDHPLPDGVTWLPLIGQPVVRRTWVVWPAGSQRRDIGRLITSFEVIDR